ncbi:MAG: hypothetical protein KME49_02185 [Brasilonema octagenarum HA4186-MV1]|jgi:hypothetical protein|nr:hypothetical protein [Brasilonema octagenarum HA4186-MV1]
MLAKGAIESAFTGGGGFRIAPSISLKIGAFSGGGGFRIALFCSHETPYALVIS